jgi:hypothetical protein
MTRGEFFRSEIKQIRHREVDQHAEYVIARGNEHSGGDRRIDAEAMQCKRN